ncbi:MAG TPA: C45 family peptidase, partial [Bacteroidales bacterium]|nr:C45 family peptidase [Bacteroidales bacterium]
MKRNILLLLAFIITPLINNAQMVKMNREITEVYLTGNGYELGLQHGQQLKPMVNRIVDRWKANVKSVTGLDPVKVMDDFFAYAAFTPAIKKWTPELFEEIRGIADGAGNSFNEIFVLNLLDEFWVYLDDPSKHHCSGMGVPARMGMPSFLSQNMDLENYTDSMQVIMHIAKDDGHPEQIILTHPGLIALNGMNETGVGVCVNTLMQLKASNKGLPVAFIIRHIIGSTDRDQIIEFIKTVEHASGQNYIIGIRDEVFDFEASANKVVRFDPENANGTVYHT